MSAYVPVTVEVRDKYMEWWIDGEYVGQSADMGEEFDAWLQSVKADAWDEGHRCAIGYVAVPNLVPEGGYKNPYREADG